MATKRQPTKTLDYEAMTDAELVRELAATYGNLLGRLDTHLDVGRGGTDDPPVPEALEAGMALHGKLDTLATAFQHGGGGGTHRLELGTVEHQSGASESRR